MRKKIATSLLLLALSATRAMAETASTELATGGLASFNNSAIELRSQSLYVSLKEIRIDYRLFNNSAAPVTIRAAFPMPEIKVGRAIDEVAVPTKNSDNILDLAAIADGRPVATTVEQRALAGGADHADFLRGQAIPIAPHLPGTNEALARLPRERWQDLVSRGLAEIVEYDDGQGVQQHLEARWVLQTTLSFEQTFRAQSELTLQLRYKPSMGVSVQTALGTPGAADQAWFKEYEDKYCIDNDFVVSVERRRGLAKSVSGAPLSEARIDLLKSMADWAGPIKDFRVVVDKGEPSNLISVCADGLKKIAPTQFAFRIENGLRQDLFVLILRRLPPNR